MVESIFGTEEILKLRIALHRGTVEEADIATGTKGAKGAVVIRAPDSHRLNLRVVLPITEDL